MPEGRPGPLTGELMRELREMCGLTVSQLSGLSGVRAPTIRVLKRMDVLDGAWEANIADTLVTLQANGSDLG